MQATRTRPRGPTEPTAPSALQHPAKTAAPALSSSADVDQSSARKLISDGARASKQEAAPAIALDAPLPAVNKTRVRIEGATLREGQKLRSFLRELVRGAMREDETKRAVHIRGALAKHPQVVEWICEGRDFAPLLKAADLELGSAADNAYRLISSALMNSLGDVFGSDAITQMVPAQFRRQLQSAAKKTAVDLSFFMWPVANAAAQTFSSLTFAQRSRLLSKLGDGVFNQVAASLNTAIESTPVSELPAVKMLLDPSAGIDLGQSLPKNKVGPFTDFVVRYYNELSIKEKQRILGALLELPPRSPIAEQLSAVVQNSPPVIQKLFQLYGRQAKSAIVKEALKEVLSGVKPVSMTAAKKAIEAELNGKKFDEVFTHLSEKPLGTGTVCQTHLARLRESGEEVVVKFVKPGVADTFERELLTLRKIAKSEFERQLVDNIEHVMREELDLRQEAKNMDSAERLYVNARVGITIAARVKAAPVTKSLVVQQKARGDVMAKLVAPDELASQAVSGRMDQKNAVRELTQLGNKMSELLRQWFEVAMFSGEGFFHADLHGGNRFLTSHEQLLTLIDFGSAATLSLEQRRGFLKLCAAVASKSPEHAVRALAELGEVAEPQKIALEQDLAALFRSRMPLLDRVEETIKAAVGRDLFVPKEIVQFSRGQVFISNELNAVNTALDKVDPQKKVERYDPLLIFLGVGARHASLEVPGTLRHRVALSLTPDRVQRFASRYVGRDLTQDRTHVFNQDVLEQAAAATYTGLLRRLSGRN